MGDPLSPRNALLAIRDRRWSPRFALACCVSLLLHLWFARELPAGAPRGGEDAPSLTVRLQSATELPEAPTAVNNPADALPVAPAVPVPRAKKRNAIMPAVEPAPGDRREDSTGIAPQADATYYAARQLDVYPALLSPLSIAYPERALAENRAGRALVMLLIDAVGKVNEVAVLEADPPGYFEEAARKTFENAAFSAARKNGVPVRSRVMIHVNFDPRAAAAEAQ